MERPKRKCIVKIDEDFRDFPGLTHRQIREMFNKEIIPNLLLKVPDPIPEHFVPLSSQWSYAVAPDAATE